MEQRQTVWHKGAYIFLDEFHPSAEKLLESEVAAILLEHAQQEPVPRKFPASAIDAARKIREKAVGMNHGLRAHDERRDDIIDCDIAGINAAVSRWYNSLFGPESDERREERKRALRPARKPRRITIGAHQSFRECQRRLRQAGKLPKTIKFGD